MMEEQTELPQELKDFIKNSNWTFAKTYANFAPHSYIVRKNTDYVLFSRLVIFIREHGVCRKWYDRIGMYLDYDGNSYWTMGNPVKQTTIINRKVSVPEDKLMELPKGTLCHSDLNPPPQKEKEIKKSPQKKLFGE
jgi:hypothetical protein